LRNSRLQSRYIEWALFVLILATGAALRLWNIGERSLWLDEGISLGFIGTPIGEMNRLLTLDVHPPLYYWALRGWMAVGEGVTWGRLLSALLSIATLPVAYAFGRLLAGRGAVLIGMGLLAVAPMGAHYGQELRMYALQSLLTTGMMATGLLAIRRPSNWRIAGSVVLGVAACYTHYFSAVFLIGFLAVLPWVKTEGEKGYGCSTVRAAVFALFAAVLYWPWLSTAIAHVFANSFAGMHAAAAPGSSWVDFQQRMIEALLGLMPSFPLSHHLPSSMAGSSVKLTVAQATLIVLFVLLLTGLAALRRKQDSRLGLAAFLGIPVLLLAAYEMCGGRMYARLLLPLLPIGFVCAGAGLLAIRHRGLKWFAGVLVGSVLLASSVSAGRYDLRDVTRDFAGQISMDSQLSETLSRPPIPVLHADVKSFWPMRAYDSVPSRHKLLSGPDAPALPRLVCGGEVMARAGFLDDHECVFVIYLEWTFDPKLREQTEKTWFQSGWQEVDSQRVRRAIKSGELVLYRRAAPSQ
jgi:4-amino-4-deoxy-L-arabinose transferase-like glycosyltransferase